MKTLKSWKWQKTTDEEYKNILGYENYSTIWKIVLTINMKQVSFCPNSGTGDNVTLFTEGNVLYVYSENESLGYAGIDIYTLDNGTLIYNEDSSIFLQSDYDFMGMLYIDNPGTAVNKFFSYSTMHKCKLLAQYISY
jgi:hypothetical protein